MSGPRRTDRLSEGHRLRPFPASSVTSGGALPSCVKAFKEGRRRFPILAAAVAACLPSAGPAVAAETDSSLPRAADILAELMVVFLIAALLEQAFAAIFDWRLYREFFNAKAVKTLVMILASAALVAFSGYDPAARILAIATTPAGQPLDPRQWHDGLTVALSALVLAGGSSDVYNLLVTPGLRSARDQAAPPKPRQGEAWFSVRILDDAGPAGERYRVRATKKSDATGEPVLAALGRRSVAERLRDVFGADRMRFPSSGGYSVQPAVIYFIAVDVVRLSPPADGGETIVTRRIWEWQGSFADRAIVDFEVRAREDV